MSREVDIKTIIPSLDAIPFDNPFEQLDEVVENLPKLEPGQYCQIEFSIYPTQQVSQEAMHNYISWLKEKGVDIGRGEGPAYGFKMHTSKERQNRRLKIFRRK